MEKDEKLVILVDDDEDDREFFTYALEGMNEGYRYITMNDGPCLINYLSDEKNKLPLMVFIDINMPRMKGLEVLAILRRKFDKTTLPVSIYTTSFHDMDKDESSKLGANVYIRKPVDVIPLKSLIKKALYYSRPHPEDAGRGMVVLWKAE